jgi:hypothetical protein
MNHSEVEKKSNPEITNKYGIINEEENISSKYFQNDPYSNLPLIYNLKKNKN